MASALGKHLEAGLWGKLWAAGRGALACFRGGSRVDGAVRADDWVLAESLVVCLGGMPVSDLRSSGRFRDACWSRCGRVGKATQPQPVDPSHRE